MNVERPTLNSERRTKETHPASHASTSTFDVLSVSDGDVVVYTRAPDAEWDANAVTAPPGDHAFYQLGDHLRRLGHRKTIFVILDHGATLQTFSEDKLAEIGLKRLGQ